MLFKIQSIWVEREKNSPLFRKKIYFKEKTTVEWIEANCALKIIFLRFSAFFLELTFYFYYLFITYRAYR